MKWRESWPSNSFIALTQSIADCRIRNEIRVGGLNKKNGQEEIENLSRQITGAARGPGGPGAGSRSLQPGTRRRGDTGSRGHGRQRLHQRIDDVDVDQ